MPDLRVTDRLSIPDDELSWAFSRSGGPGGQNVNKVASKAELRWTPRTSRALTDADRAWLLERIGARLTATGELIVVSTLTRDQIKNRADAEAKLVELVRAALHRPKVRRATKPSRGSKERRLTAKRVRGEVKRGRRGGDD
ncbi:MAG: aminoacyl-tRNA hydrolase [Kofleriaceae bacterium]|jgi:ribosome-associated protein|nr:aminoacyl-tRNA hydrolase [Kofleriaceae bacterium]MBP6840909.1 aminoacyl-tRNA hydrolase [Kofleriaceae bacterium]MBP9208616.1 aminoacyl-tRNA hydrolase [Kofleriaceae bacterium]